MRLRAFPVVLAAASLPSLACAVEFSYSGFSTAAYAQTDTDEAAVGYVGQPEGIDSDGSFAIDSKLGAQLTARFNHMFSATVQGVAYADLTSDWEPHLDWAYVRFQPVAGLSARAGYLRAPTFMYSDSVFIGYANTWIRPPLEVYNLSPAYQLRGVDLAWQGNVGPVSVSVQTYYGDSELKVGSAESTIDVKDWAGVAMSGQYDAFMARIGYSEIELNTTTAQLVPLVAALNAVPAVFCGVCASEAARLDLKGTVFETLDIGGQYDDGTNLGIVEYARRRSGSYVVPDMYSAYATYGHRFGGLTPYATYAIARREGASGSVIPAAGPLAALAAGVNATIAAANDDQDSYSLGVRYELPSYSVLNGALVKLQYDHIDAKDGNGMLNDVQAGFDGTVNMFSLSLDFVF